MQAVYAEFLEWVDAVVRNIPGRVGSRIRRHWLSKRLNCSDLYTGTGCRFVNAASMSFSEQCGIGDRGYFSGPITCGRRVAFNAKVHIDASGGRNIRIGDSCLIGPNVAIRTANHWDEAGDIAIEDDCWLGANVIVLGGVRIGRGTVVGAGAVVTKDVPPMSVAVGVPAKVIKQRGAN